MPVWLAMLLFIVAWFAFVSLILIPVLRSMRREDQDRWDDLCEYNTYDVEKINELYRNNA